jgi:hypothetical protein
VQTDPPPTLIVAHLEIQLQACITFEIPGEVYLHFVLQACQNSAESQKTVPADLVKRQILD